jgi:hypothetical protein
MDEYDDDRSKALQTTCRYIALFVAFLILSSILRFTARRTLCFVQSAKRSEFRERGEKAACEACIINSPSVRGDEG